MKEIFVIERLLCPGVWELFSKVFYTNESEANIKCFNIINDMKKREKGFCARVIKLVSYD